MHREADPWSSLFKDDLG